jgi:hypothetical protein
MRIPSTFGIGLIAGFCGGILGTAFTGNRSTPPVQEAPRTAAILRSDAPKYHRFLSLPPVRPLRTAGRAISSFDVNVIVLGGQLASSFLRVASPRGGGAISGDLQK